MWQPLDVQALLYRRDQLREATFAANVGSYEVPLGAVLRPPPYPFPVGAQDGYEIPQEYVNCLIPYSTR